MRACDFPYLNGRFAAMAHRGGPGWEPNSGVENTLAAFQRVADLGYRYIETDVQATRDQRLVCFHDPDLVGATGLPGRVADYSASQLSRARVGGREPLAFFDQVVEALPETRFNVDLKTDDAVEPLARLIERHQAHDRILVDSFSQARISRFRLLVSGRVATAMAPPGAAWSALVPLLPRVVASPAPAWQVPLRQQAGPFSLPVVTAASIARVHQVGKAVHVWTVNRADQMRRLIDLGVDGIITDRPDVLKDILIQRDLWENS